VGHAIAGRISAFECGKSHKNPTAFIEIEAGCVQVIIQMSVILH
jgi:hypothetical protein